MAKAMVKKKTQKKQTGRAPKRAATGAKKAAKATGEPAPLDPIAEALRRRRAALLAH